MSCGTLGLAERLVSSRVRPVVPWRSALGEFDFVQKQVRSTASWPRERERERERVEHLVKHQKEVTFSTTRSPPP